ncbi:MAG: c-type cytochrome [Bacteroidota bacterium]|jgi:thiosulfate dehydrogenase|nr:c-type cytochrome [Algoriphagus sp.]
MAPFQKLFNLSMVLFGLVVGLIILIVAVAISSFSDYKLLQFTNQGELPSELEDQSTSLQALADPETLWKAPALEDLNLEPNADELQYGKDLIANTAEYLGPHGKVKSISNGMNCQNCHLQAGTLPFGNNFAAVASTYPKFRARSGTEEDIQKRINDCLERSLNGKPLDRNSKEMKAMVAYISWVGKEVPKGEIPKGTGIFEVPLLDRAADPIKGKVVYEAKCASCHQSDGKGQMKPEGKGYLYPPLWGEGSYNHGAGLYRLSRFAGYVKANMPLGATFENPQLTDEESWDVAAYVNSLDRPSKDLSRDWPDISKKPMDHPFGPFSDGFPEEQHKYGPFGPIKAAATNRN